MARVEAATDVVPGFEDVGSAGTQTKVGTAARPKRDGCLSTAADGLGYGCDLAGCLALEGCFGCGSVLVLAALALSGVGGLALVLPR